MKKIAVLYSEYVPVIDAIKCHLQNAEVFVYDFFPKNFNEFDLIVSINLETPSDIPVLKSYHSLLPAFEKSDEPVRDAILYGAKITGLTIYFENPFKIVFQYSLILDNLTHYDEIEQELKYLEQVAFPIVIEKIINNEPIDIKKIFSNGCNGNCGGCGGCNH